MTQRSSEKQDLLDLQDSRANALNSNPPNRRRSSSVLVVLTFVGALAAALGWLSWVSPSLAYADAAKAPTTATATPVTVGAAASKDTDEDAPDSPRASMRSFLDLAERSRYAEAARYIDVPRGAEKRTEELARKLYIVLSERLWVDPEQLSGTSQGKKDDTLPAGTEELGKIKDAKGHAISIRIVRHEARTPEDEARWVFSQSTMQNVDALYATLQGRWLREHLPNVLIGQGWWALYYWQWLALPLLAAVCIAVGRFFTWISGVAIRRVLSKWKWGVGLLPRLSRPVTMGWAVLLFWGFVPYLGLTLRADELIERLLRALGWLAFFWALLRTVTVAGEEMSSAAWARSKPSMRSLTGVGVKLGKLFVAALALMVAFSELGYPVTSIVAGLGIGGVALALAAQKTVENLFGSVSILADQPFVVGDTIRVDTVEGAVETIGLRSTRLRTAERTLIIMPNGKLADMRIESLGPRDRIRFATKLSLARSTSAVQLRAVITSVRARLQAQPLVRKEDVFVQLSALGESSFDIDVVAMVETRDFGEFARIREELLLLCVGIVEQFGATFAVAERRILATRAGSQADGQAD